MGLIRWGRWGQMTPIHISTPGGADDPNQATRRIRVGDERGVDALGERQRIRIVTGADDDSGMSALGILMKTDEVDAVQRENRAVLFDGELKNLIVGNLLVCPSCLV